jgi:recombination protein RecR
MNRNSLYIERVILVIRKFPNIGYRAAEKIAYSFLDWSEGEVKELTDAINEMRRLSTPCPICNALTENGTCLICSDPLRDHRTILVVENIKNLTNIEQTKTYNGLYHVLECYPSKSQTFATKSVVQLKNRVLENDIKEVIIATNATVEGETLALYVAKTLFEATNVKISRIAYGLPSGGKLEFADDFSLSQAIKARQQVELERK